MKRMITDDFHSLLNLIAALKKQAERIGDKDLDVTVSNLSQLMDTMVLRETDHRKEGR